MAVRFIPPRSTRRAGQGARRASRAALVEVEREGTGPVEETVMAKDTLRQALTITTRTRDRHGFQLCPVGETALIFFRLRG